MAGELAANRYAKALFSWAEENDKLAEMDKDIRLIDNTIKNSKELRFLLKSPVIKDEKKLSCLEEIFSAVDKQSLRLFTVLYQNKRLELLPKIAERFKALVDEQNKVTTAVVTTAVPLSPEMESRIIEKVKEITGNDASLIKKVDEQLIGGFLLRIGDLEYDASIRGKLNQIKQEFRQNV